MIALDLTPFYDTGPAGFANSVTLGAATFPAILDTADAAAYALAPHTTHTLRVQNFTAIAANDLLTIDGRTYKVIDTPRRINTAERVASLALQP